MAWQSFKDKTKDGQDTTAKDVISSITLSKLMYIPILTMSRYSDDRMSVMPKKGNPPSHDRAVDAVEDFIKTHPKTKGLVSIEREWLQKFSTGFIKMHKMDKDKQRTFFGHSYDMVVKDLFLNRVLYVIEVGDVGDDTKHNAAHPSQLIEDGLAEAWIEFYYNHLPKFVRINKDDCFYPDKLQEKIFDNGDIIN